MKPRKTPPKEGAGSGCMARLVRLRGVGSWWGWRDLAWSALVYWPAGAFWGCCLVHLVLRPALGRNQEQRQQEFRQHQESQAISEIEAASPVTSDSTLGWQKAGDEGYLTDPPATSQSPCCPSCVWPLGQWLHNPLIEWHHGPSEGHVLELGPYFILPNKNHKP